MPYLAPLLSIESLPLLVLRLPPSEMQTSHCSHYGCTSSSKTKHARWTHIFTAHTNIESAFLPGCVSDTKRNWNFLKTESNSHQLGKSTAQWSSFEYQRWNPIKNGTCKRYRNRKYRNWWVLFSWKATVHRARTWRESACGNSLSRETSAHCQLLQESIL